MVLYSFITIVLLNSFVYLLLAFTFILTCLLAVGPSDQKPFCFCSEVSSDFCSPCTYANIFLSLLNVQLQSSQREPLCTFDLRMMNGICCCCKKETYWIFVLHNADRQKYTKKGPVYVRTKDDSVQVKIETRASFHIFTQQLINHIYEMQSKCNCTVGMFCFIAFNTAWIFNKP